MTTPSPESTSYTVVLHPDTLRDITHYGEDLATGRDAPGGRLRAVLGARRLDPREGRALLDALIATKLPKVFAESAVRGDGSDWTARELSLLGGIGVASRVQVFDDGTHRGPRVHPAPFEAWLLFTPGPLLRCDLGGVPADWGVVEGSHIEASRYGSLIERRVLPLLGFINEAARAAARRVVVTIPGLGCGQFAGPFRGRMGAELDAALRALLRRQAHRLPAIRTVHFDPFEEGTDDEEVFAHLRYRVRPSRRSARPRPQLDRPERFQEPGDPEAPDLLASFVAWDHVSWPGNDFFGGLRATDDGVKAAATDAMRALTGVEGSYDAARNAYLPPAPDRTWGALVTARQLQWSSRDHLWILPPDSHGEKQGPAPAR